MGKQNAEPKRKKEVRQMLVSKVQTLTSNVNNTLIGRSREVEASMAALLANEHCVFIGEPGTAKSMVVDQISKRVSGINYFWIQLFAETPPTDVFGQISLRALEQEDINRRNTAGHLPEANVAFLDEIFQARSSILVGCNSIMQERRYMNGNAKVAAPIRSVFGASNFFPEDEQLIALWDRFMVRRKVSALTTEEDIKKMISAPDPEENPAPDVTLAELDEAHRLAMALPAGNDVIDSFIEVLAKLSALQRPITVSDRRKKKAWKLLRAKAWLNGRSEVTPYEFPVLSYVLWNKPEDIVEVETLLADYAPIEASKINAVIDAMKPHLSQLSKLQAGGGDLTQYKAAAMTVLSKINEVHGELKQYEARTLTDPGAQTALMDANKMIREAQVTIMSGLGFDPAMFAGQNMPPRKVKK